MEKAVTGLYDARRTFAGWRVDGYTQVMADSVGRVIEAAAALGLSIDVRRFPAGTKTAADAARAIGCPVAAIVKSLVFTVDRLPVVALVPGDRRLDPSRLAKLAGGSEVRRAGLDEARAATGFVAGGTPPFGYPTPLRVFADSQLKRHDPVWAAAGTPDSVFSINIAALDESLHPTWGDISE
jgi:prolyl-tRNA editing enzyme YbaK/EbsC (Cys-tRNA(Pro) deacylase)